MCILYCFKFPVVLVALLGSTIPISIIGNKFAMSFTPFWDPFQFSKMDDLALSKLHLTLICFSVPIVGMLCGNCVAGIVVAVGHIIKEFQYVHIGSSLPSFIFLQIF